MGKNIAHLVNICYKVRLSEWCSSSPEIEVPKSSGLSCWKTGIKYAHIPQPFGWVPCKIRVSGQGMWRINPGSQRRQIKKSLAAGFLLFEGFK